MTSQKEKKKTTVFFYLFLCLLLFNIPLKVAHVYEMSKFSSTVSGLLHQDRGQKRHCPQQKLPLIQDGYWAHSIKRRVSIYFCEF